MWSAIEHFSVWGHGGMVGRRGDGGKAPPLRDSWKWG